MRMLPQRATIATSLLACGLLPAFPQEGVFFCPDHPNQPHLSIHHGLAADLMPTCQVSNGGLDATITVRTPTEILWKIFGVTEGGSLRIKSANGVKFATVHRVTTNSRAFVAGALSSTGNLALLTEAGLSVTETGSIVAPRFLGSTLIGVDSKALLDGRDATFSSTTVFGTDIRVDGRVTAPEGVVLIAEDIFVNGSVLAPRGRVVMGAGGTVTLRAPGTIEIESKNQKGSIVNSGVIEGEAVEMRLDGQLGPDISAVTNTGIIRATGDVIIDPGTEPMALITNTKDEGSTLDPIIKGNRIILSREQLRGVAVDSFGTVDGSNPAGVSATRQFVGTGAARATQIRPIQLSTVQRETSLAKKAKRGANQKKKKKAPIAVASSRSAAGPGTPASEKEIVLFVTSRFSEPADLSSFHPHQSPTPPSRTNSPRTCQPNCGTKARLSFFQATKLIPLSFPDSEIRPLRVENAAVEFRDKIRCISI